jgi:hypothetical protein
MEKVDQDLPIPKASKKLGQIMADRQLGPEACSMLRRKINPDPALADHPG